MPGDLNSQPSLPRDDAKVGAACLAVLDRCGIRYERQGDEVRFLCPAHDDRTPSFDLNVVKGRGCCRSCGHVIGSAGKLLIALGQCSTSMEASRWLRENNIPSGYGDGKPRRKQRDWSPAGPYNGGPGEAPDYERMAANYAADERQQGSQPIASGETEIAPAPKPRRPFYDRDEVPLARRIEACSIVLARAREAMANGSGGPFKEFLADERKLPDPDRVAALYGLGAELNGTAVRALEQAGFGRKEIFDLGLLCRGGKRPLFDGRLLAGTELLLPEAQGKVGGMLASSLLSKAEAQQDEGHRRILYQAGMQTSSSVFGLKQATALLREGKPQFDRLIGGEGMWDAAQAVARNFPGYALLGSNPHAIQIQALLEADHRAVISLDGDDAGDRGLAKAVLLTLDVIRDGDQPGFLLLPEGEDLDGLLKSEGGAEALRCMLEDDIYDLRAALSNVVMRGDDEIERLTIAFAAFEAVEHARARGGAEGWCGQLAPAIEEAAGANHAQCRTAISDAHSTKAVVAESDMRYAMRPFHDGEDL